MNTYLGSGSSRSSLVRGVVCEQPVYTPALSGSKSGKVIEKKRTKQVNLSDDVRSIGTCALVNNCKEDGKMHYLVQCVVGRYWHRVGVQHESLSQKCKKTVCVHDFNLSPVETATHTHTETLSLSWCVKPTGTGWDSNRMQCQGISPPPRRHKLTNQLHSLLRDSCEEKERCSLWQSIQKIPSFRRASWIVHQNAAVPTGAVGQLRLMAGAAQLATSALNTLQSLQTQQQYLLIDSYANGDDLYRLSARFGTAVLSNVNIFRVLKLNSR